MHYTIKLKGQHLRHNVDQITKFKVRVRHLQWPVFGGFKSINVKIIYIYKCC